MDVATEEMEPFSEAGMFELKFLGDGRVLSQNRLTLKGLVLMPIDFECNSYITHEACL